MAGDPHDHDHAHDHDHDHGHDHAHDHDHHHDHDHDHAHHHHHDEHDHAHALDGARSSEIQRIARPLLAGMAWTIRYSHWPLLLLAVLYAATGVTTVQEDEVALVLRFGRLVGDTPEEQVHGPGLLLALPRPIDEVVRVPIKKIHEVVITDLDRAEFDPESDVLAFPEGETIDPEVDGYALTGDRNILHVALVARYVVRDPVTYALRFDDPHDLLRDAVLSATVEAMGATTIEAMMKGGRRQPLVDALADAQRVLDDADAGLELVSIEYGKPIAVPPQVYGDFIAVEDARIEQATTVRAALRYRETELPNAEAERDAMLREAQIFAAEKVARARGDAAVFEAIAAEERRHPGVVRERIWRERIEKALANAGKKLYIPPPPDEDGYRDMRITISPRR